MEENKEIIINVSRLDENQTGVSILKEVYNYEVISAIILLIDRVFRNSKEEFLTSEDVDNKFEELKKEYKQRFSIGDDNIGEENNQED